MMAAVAKLLGLKGRIGRLNYWLLLSLAVMIAFVAATFGSLNLESPPIQWLSYAILLISGWPVISATTRRLRDTDLSPWFGLLLIAAPTAIQFGALAFTSAARGLGIAAAVVTIVGFVVLGVVPGKECR
jgi:uncharacterized membrane protein YhaH (DUF805 family)